MQWVGIGVFKNVVQNALENSLCSGTTKSEGV